MPEKKERLWPGDEGYQGGTSSFTLRIDGQNKEAKVVKDKDGNVVYASLVNKVLGIF